MSNLLDWLVQHEPLFRKSRLPSLYSDLSVQRSTNPDGYAANVTAWQSALKRAAVAGQLQAETKLILQTSDDLLDALASPEYGRPSGLGAVLDDSVRSGKMVDLVEFQTAERSIYHRSWVPSPWSVLQWSLRQIGLGGGGSYDVSGRLKLGSLVLVQALEEVSKQILAQQSKRGQSVTDRVVSRETFATDIQEQSGEAISHDDLEVLLRYLSRDKQALSYDSKTVKFKSPTSSSPDPITEQDTAIANLKRLISDLNTQVSLLHSRISLLHSTARTAVECGSKASALSALRSKKLAERTLEQRTNTLHQLEEVYANLEAAADQVEIVAAMKQSAGVLRGLNAKVGGVESVDAVMDQLREEMGITDDVGSVLREPVGQNAVLDEEEVDEEFEAMEAQERAKREEAEAKERKVREEQEAERTRRRLAELESNGQPARKEDGNQVDKAAKRLSQMSIEDISAKGAENGGETQDLIAEQA